MRRMCVQKAAEKDRQLISYLYMVVNQCFLIHDEGILLTRASKYSPQVLRSWPSQQTSFSYLGLSICWLNICQDVLNVWR